MPAQNEKFVGRFEMAVMQYVILQKAKQGEVTKENLQQLFKSGNLQMKGEHLQHCIDQLQQENHIKVEGNKIKITDDGREDVQEVSRLVVELPQYANGGAKTGTGGQQQKPGMTQTQTTGGSMGTSGQSGGGSSGPQNRPSQQGGSPQGGSGGGQNKNV